MKKIARKIVKNPNAAGKARVSSRTAEKNSSGTNQANSGTKKNSSGLRIRMYRVGFGDFFLMTVPSPAGPQHIVIDCGVTRGKTGKGDIGTIKQAVADMARETGGKLALIIITHRHMDHIIGFSRCPEFEGFKGKVDGIWMPVWENEYQSHVKKLQEELSEMALGVQNHLAAAADRSEETLELLAMAENATGDEMASREMFGVAGTGGGNNKASLDLLKEGLGVKPQYYCKGQKPELPKALVDAGLTAEILGPPPIDAIQFVKLKDLKKGVGQYLDTNNQAAADPKKLCPFATGFECLPETYAQEKTEEYRRQYREYAFREWQATTRDKQAQEDPKPWIQIQRAVESAQPEVLLTAVKQLDSFLNNQSLVVLFTFNDKKLLFAGDAQAGNWEYWLYDDDKPDRAPSGKLGEEGEKVLGHLDFYKVGHHGSTNATPIAAVNAMNAGFVAMCSTQEDSFGSVANASEVPRVPLMKALAEKQRTVVRSDQITVKVNGEAISPAPDAPRDWSKLGAGELVIGPCYVDYLL